MLDRQRVNADRLKEFSIPALEGALAPDGHVQAGRVPAGKDGHPGRRADRAGGVGIGKAHTLPGQAIEVRGPVKIIAVAGQARPPEVIGQDEDQVRRWACLQLEDKSQQQSQAIQGKFH